MNNKPEIKETIVVEGKSDTAKLKSFFNVNTIETNGSALDKKTIELIKLANEKNGVILFLDPDGPGEKIRKQITNELPFVKQCFIKKSDIQKNSKKIGVAEAYKQAIIDALNNVVIFDKHNQTISLEQYNSLNINSVNQRQKICDYLKISLCNNKQLLKRLNMIGVSFEQLKNILNK